MKKKIRKGKSTLAIAFAQFIENKISDEKLIRLKSLSRFKNKEWLKGNKADLWVMGFSNPSGESIKVKCEECGRDCFATLDNEDLIEKNAKRICISCAISKEKYNKNIPKEQLDYLKKLFERIE